MWQYHLLFIAALAKDMQRIRVNILVLSVQVIVRVIWNASHLQHANLKLSPKSLWRRLFSQIRFSVGQALKMLHLIVQYHALVVHHQSVQLVSAAMDILLAMTEIAFIVARIGMMPQHLVQNHVLRGEKMSVMPTKSALDTLLVRSQRQIFPLNPFIVVSPLLRPP